MSILCSISSSLQLVSTHIYEGISDVLVVVERFGSDGMFVLSMCYFIRSLVLLVGRAVSSAQVDIAVVPCGVFIER